MFRKSRGSVNTGIIIGVTAIALVGVLWIVYSGNNDSSSASLGVRELVQDKKNNPDKKRALVDVNDSYNVEKRLANASVYTTDKSMKDEITYLVKDLKEEVRNMNTQSELFENDINFQEIMTESDELVSEIAKETGVAKQELLQEAENEILAPVSLPATIELEQEIVVTEQRKNELVNRFEAFSSESE